MPVFTVDQLLAAVPTQTEDCYKHDSSGKIQSASKNALVASDYEDNYGATKKGGRSSQFRKNYPLILTLDKIAMPEATWVSTRSDSSFFLNDGVEI